jgi:hypothetical protein
MEIILCHRTAKQEVVRFEFELVLHTFAALFGRSTVTLMPAEYSCHLNNATFERGKLRAKATTHNNMAIQTG